MVRLVGALSLCLAALLLTALPGSATASADSSVQQVGATPIPAGPAPAWIVADMDTGQILAGRDQYAPHAPASTIKTLLALVALDEIPLDATVVADEADAKVECTCVGIKAGRTYTTRQLLDAALLVSGNDAANTLAHMSAGPTPRWPR